MDELLVGEIAQILMSEDKGNDAPCAIGYHVLAAIREAGYEIHPAIGECICPKCGIRHGGSTLDGGF